MGGVVTSPVDVNCTAPQLLLFAICVLVVVKLMPQVTLLRRHGPSGTEMPSPNRETRGTLAQLAGADVKGFSHEVQAVCALGKMQHVTPEQEALINDLVVARECFQIVKVCEGVTGAFVGRVRRGEDLSFMSSMTTNQRQSVKDNIEDAHKAVLDCADACELRNELYVDALEELTSLGESAEVWLKALQRLEQCPESLAEYAKRVYHLKTEGVRFSTQKLKQFEKTNKEAEYFSRRIGKLCKRPGLGFKHTVKESTRDLMECIVWSFPLQASENEHVREARKTVDELFRRMGEASSCLETARAEASGVQIEIDGDTAYCKDKMWRLQAAQEQAQQGRRNTGGTGQWLIEGAPNDPKSRRLQEAWDSKCESELTPYTSGSFKLWFDAKATFEQTVAECELDSVAQKLNKASAELAGVESKKGRLATLRRKIDDLQQLYKTARAEYEEAESKVKMGLQTLPPALQAQVTTLKWVVEATQSCARHFVPCRVQFKRILDDLRTIQELTAEGNDGTVIELLQVVQDMVRVVNDPNSGFVVLRKLGANNLNKVMLPTIDPAKASKLFIGDDDHSPSDSSAAQDPFGLGATGRLRCRQAAIASD